ncbi:MAG: hypothetical protein HY533_03615 [Chloroflexi bacterium]|nr:hypothetical protein [Chloroflexota bacterium]
MTADKALVGATGVHYVAFHLSKRGYAVGLTAPGIKDVDLLVTNTDTGKSIAIQVKTMTQAHVNSRRWGSYWKWRIGKDVALAVPKSGLFWAFVDLKGGSSFVPEAISPDVFIVPSADLKPPLVESFPEPSKGPPTDFWCDIYEKDLLTYKERWDRIANALT